MYSSEYPKYPSNLPYLHPSIGTSPGTNEENQIELGTSSAEGEEQNDNPESSHTDA